MPEKLLDNIEPHRTREGDADVDANAAGGPAPIPQVSINRSTVAELERRRILRAQATALLILAIAAVLTMLYVAKLILVIVLISILIAFVLAPLVDLLNRFDIPNALASLIAVLLLVIAVGAATYVSYSRALSFMQELPQYKARIQQMMGRVREQAEQIEQTTETVMPSSEADKKTVTVRQSSTWTDMVSRNASSVSEMVLAITFVPFLVFFMLSWQDHVRSATVMLFRMKNRNTAYVTLGLISSMIRSFIVGNVLVGLFIGATSTAIFGLLHLPYFYFIGFISGFLSLVPYLGVVLAVVPPLVGGIGMLNSGTVIVVLATVLGLHLFALNVLYPKFLGSRLQLNPLAVTVALMVWGWLWGGMGLVLAVPVTAAIKIVFDHIESMRGYGAWLGE